MCNDTCSDPCYRSEKECGLSSLQMWEEPIPQQGFLFSRCRYEQLSLKDLAGVFGCFMIRALNGFCPRKRALKLLAHGGRCFNYIVSVGVSNGLVIPQLLVVILLPVLTRSSNYYCRWVFMQCSLGRFWVFRRVCLESSRQAWDSVDDWIKLKVLTLNKWIIWMPVCSGTIPYKQPYKNMMWYISSNSRFWITQMTVWGATYVSVQGVRCYVNT